MRLWIPLVLSLSLGAAHAAKTTGEEQLDPDTVLFSRGEAAITARDFRAALERVPEKYRRSAATDAEAATRLLSQLLENRLLAVEARESGVADDPMTRAAVRAETEKILARRQIEHVVSKRLDANLEAMAREYYRAHPDEFQRPPLLTVRHVLISREDRSDQAALDRAIEVRKKAAEGADFGALVEEYSDDEGSRDKGGLYEEVSADELVEPFAKAARRLGPGEISEPVKTPYGYHVIKLIAKEDRGVKPFAKVRSRIMDKLEQRQYEQVRQNYVKELINRHPLDINEEAIKAMRRQFEPHTEPDSGSGE